MTSDHMVRVLCGDSLTLLAELADGSVDAVVTDPPYGLADLPPKVVIKALTEWLGGDRWFVPDGKGFMSKDWDRFVPPPAAWDECFRVMRPGAYLLAFSAPRTADLMGLSIRLAGFEVHDSLHWITGQGFPKAKSRLKPAHEPIIMARKPAKANPPLPGLDSCKVTHANGADLAESQSKNPGRDDLVTSGTYGANRPQQSVNGEGRWPPNLLLTHSADCRAAGTRDVESNGHHPAQRGPGGVGTSGHTGQTGLDERKSGTETVTAWDCAPGCPVAGLDAQSPNARSSGVYKPVDHGPNGNDTARDFGKAGTPATMYADKGGASRFYPQFTWSPDYDLPFLYCAKAAKRERPQVEGVPGHPTVKPLALMRWLARLITPPGGTVLDLFAGTGTTGEAAALEGFPAILMEQDPGNVQLIRARLARPHQTELGVVV